MKKYILIKVDWLRIKVHVYFVDDVVAFRNGKLLKKFPKIPKMDYSKAFALHTYSAEYPWDYFITLNEKSTWGTIAHECYHCAKSILENDDIDNEEATAHMLSYLIEEIQTKLEKDE